MPSLQDLIAQKKARTEGKELNPEEVKVEKEVTKEPEQENKSELASATSILDEPVKSDPKPFADPDLKNLNLPSPPEIGSPPSNFLRYQLTKLELLTDQSKDSKDTLKELHANLKDNPELEELLMPEDLGSITRAMQTLTQRTHVKKQTAKTKRISNKVAKETKISKVTDGLKGIF